MGYSWSSFIAQSTLLEIAVRSGIPKDIFLSASQCNAETIQEFGFAAGLATDDFFQLARDPVRAEASLNNFKVALVKEGVIRQEAKDVTSQKSGVVIGVELDQGIRFRPVAKKASQTWDLALDILESDVCSGRLMQQLLGSLQWNDLLCRCRLSIYDKVYRFIRNDNELKMRALPGGACLELLASLGTSSAWMLDLTLAFSDMLGTSDASGEFGYGVSVAPLREDTARFLCSLAEKRGDYVILGARDGVPAAKSRIGTPHELNMTTLDFADVISLRASDRDHIVIRELAALLLLVKWWLRCKKHHMKRLVALVDSKSALGAAVKGRSSSRGLNRLLRKLASLLIASGSSLFLVYIPTEFNPSDFPSRGLQRRPRFRRLQRPRRWPRSLVRLNTLLWSNDRKAAFLNAYFAREGIHSSSGSDTSSSVGGFSFDVIGSGSSNTPL